MSTQVRLLCMLMIKNVGISDKKGHEIKKVTELESNSNVTFEYLHVKARNYDSTYVNDRVR